MYDLIVIGGGPAGLAAAYAAWNKGLKHIAILERDKELGGILNQCIHFDTGYFVINTQRYVRSVHQLSELFNVIFLQRFHCLDRTLILINSMLCSLASDIILDR